MNYDAVCKVLTTVYKIHKGVLIMTASSINIFFTINNNYTKYLAVTIASILSNSNRSFSFYILDSNISETNKTKIEELKKIRPFKIEYLPIDKSLFNMVPQSSQKYISSETNYRFLISSLKPTINKCLFLDADLIANDDLGKLWDIDISDAYMAAVVDQAPQEKGSWVNQLPLPTQFLYVNTGVTIMNLQKWREDNIEKKLFENIKRYANLLKYPDQDILNITLAPQIKYLSHVFNAMPVQQYLSPEQEREAFSAPIIIHWAGPQKPWIIPTAKLADVFWKYAATTPFFLELLFDCVQNICYKTNQPLIKQQIKHYTRMAKISFGRRKQKNLQKIKELKEQLI